MTLAEQVLEERKRRSNNPDFVTHLSDDVKALCDVLERKGLPKVVEKAHWHWADGC